MSKKLLFTVINKIYNQIIIIIKLMFSLKNESNELNKTINKQLIWIWRKKLVQKKLKKKIQVYCMHIMRWTAVFYLFADLCISSCYWSACRLTIILLFYFGLLFFTVNGAQMQLDLQNKWSAFYLHFISISIHSLCSRATLAKLSLTSRSYIIEPTQTEKIDLNKHNSIRTEYIF